MAERARWSRAGATIFAVMAGVAGCLDDNPWFVEPTETATSNASQVGSTGALMTEGEGDSSTSTSATTTTSDDNLTSPAPPPSCGDGVVDAGEECDLGDMNSDAGACTSSCKQAVCGDGLVHAGFEACDDANNDASDGCVNCLAPRTCKEIHAAVPMAPTGVYSVDPDGSGVLPPRPVFCDMELRGGGWTLVERNPLADPLGEALFKDAPHHETDPMNERFRLSRAAMAAIGAQSSELWLDCYGPDHLLAPASALFFGEGKPQGCLSVEAVMYKEAQLLGHMLKDVELCTRYESAPECAGVWGIDEGLQMYCGLNDFPWDPMPVALPGTAAFALDGPQLDPEHDCHALGAVRRIMVR
jgi:cysteine-rich repeat protein